MERSGGAIRVGGYKKERMVSYFFSGALGVRSHTQEASHQRHSKFRPGRPQNHCREHAGLDRVR